MKRLAVAMLFGLAFANARPAVAQDGLTECRMTTAECEAQVEALEEKLGACENALEPVAASDIATRLRSFRWSHEPGELTVRKRRNRLIVQLPAEVLFDSGKTTVKPKGARALAEIATLLKTIKGRIFLVAGHTDNVPIAQKNAALASNWQLSSLRAIAVVQLLVEAGVAPKQLGAVGYGEHQPQAKNSTAAGRAHNRRIEIVIMPEPGEMEPLPDEIGGDPPSRRRR